MGIAYNAEVAPVPLRGQPEGLATALHLSVTRVQLSDPPTRLLPWKGNHSHVSHLKISPFIRAGSSCGLCFAGIKTCAFFVRGVCLDRGAMRKLSKLERKEKKHAAIWSNHKLHLLKNCFFVAVLFPARVPCDTSLPLVRLGMENVDETLVAS